MTDEEWESAPVDAIKRTCGICYTDIFWQECPTGGWWIHRNHPCDNHDAEEWWR